MAETRFDDPGQPAPRRGGNGWIRIPLPGGLYINAYRSMAGASIGVQVRFPGPDGLARYRDLAVERDAIDAEFTAQAVALPDWRDGEVPELILIRSSPLPWSEFDEEDQRAWLGRAANQFVNSLRPRLQGSPRELAA